MTEELPAILGGTPAHPDGPPAWPGVSKYVTAVFHSLQESGDWGRYHGPNCEALKEAFGEYHGTEHVHLCSSGTVGIELALRAAKVQPGDEVVLSAYDFKANMQNVLSLGAVPVLVDLDPKTWQLATGDLERAINRKTKAIIASHLHGGHVEIAEVMEIASASDVVVIEDACQNPGALVAGRKSGTTGHIGVHSFGGSKLLTAGRGGAVITNRSDIAQRIRLYTQRGNDAYPLSEMQAAVLLPQLRLLDGNNEKRLASAFKIARVLRQSEFLKPICQLSDPIGTSLTDLKSTSINQPAFYKFGCQFRHEVLKRDQFAKAIRAEGIAFDAGFAGLHRTHSKRRFRATNELPTATEAHHRCVVLHHPLLLEGESAVNSCIEAIRKIELHAEALARVIPSC